MKRLVICWILLSVFAILAVVFAVLTVLSLVPSSGDTGITVKEPFTVSSSALSAGDGTLYGVQIGGVLKNTENKRQNDVEVRVEISDGDRTKTLLLTDEDLSEIDATFSSWLPRTSFTVRREWTDATPYDEIRSVTVTVGDRSEELFNGTSGLFGGGALFWILLLAADAFGLTYWGKQTYYLYQERKLDAEGDGAGKKA